MRTLLITALAALAGLVVNLLFADQGHTATGLAILAVVAVLWLSEAWPVSVTALLVPLLAVASSTLTMKEALASFANPIIYLFMGGFALAAALKTHHIDQWLANSMVRVARGDTRIAVFGLFAATAFISMWISNTATTAMMLPVILGLIGRLNTPQPGTLVFIMLGIAYSANIGGIGTLVGSPPNAIAAATLGLSFTDWLVFGIPIVLILLPLVLTVLWILLRPDLTSETGSLTTADSAQLTDDGPIQPDSTLLSASQPDTTMKGKEYPYSPPMVWTGKAIATMSVFLAVVALWLFSAPLSDILGINKDFDAFVAVAAIVCLVSTGLLEWKTFRDTTDWGVLLLFGGGITLSVVLSSTGASRFLADGLVTTFDGISPWMFLALAIALMVFLTELASNTASAALLVPIFYSLPASQTGLEPQLLAIGVAIAASCAFMLPVATPPNALVYGTGLVPQKQMIRCGLVINLICILVLTTLLELLAG